MATTPRETPAEAGRRLARERNKPLTEEQIEGAARILAAAADERDRRAAAAVDDSAA